MAGSITLVGGHGTGAAYAERFAEVNNLQSVMELSMTVATIGLIVGGIIAGPVAQYLITRYKLRSQATADERAAEARGRPRPITTVGMIGALAGIFAAVVAGRWLAAKFSGGAITMPAFLWCMMLGVAIRNLVPFAGIRFDDRASDLISGRLPVAVPGDDDDGAEPGRGRAVGRARSSSSSRRRSWSSSLYAIFVCFRFMGRDYEAAVTSAAFIGFNMGSTATAMANMQAITAKYGPAPQSYLIVPLAGAFFIDLMNAFLLTLIWRCRSWEAEHARASPSCCSLLAARRLRRRPGRRRAEERRRRAPRRRRCPRAPSRSPRFERRGSQSDTKAPAGETRRIVYFDAELKLERDFDFGAWDSPGVAGIVSALGAGPKGIVGITSGGNKAGDVVRAHGTALYKREGDGWVPVAAGGYRPTAAPAYATNAPQGAGGDARSDAQGGRVGAARTRRPRSAR